MESIMMGMVILMRVLTKASMKLEKFGLMELTMIVMVRLMR